MKTVLLLLLAMLAIKTTTMTSATGQDACSKVYVSCLDKCTTRPSKTLQDSCMEMCQSQNNGCFSKVFGAPGPGMSQTVRQEPQVMGAPPPTPAPAAAEEPRPAAKAAAARVPKPAMKPAERRPQ